MRVSIIIIGTFLVLCLQTWTPKLVESRNLGDFNDLMRLHAVADCVSNFESFVERSENNGDRLSGAPIMINLKMESVDQAYDYFKGMSDTLKAKVKANLPRIAELADTLLKNHGQYLWLRTTYGESERYTKDQEHIVELALEYRRSRWLRLKAMPEVNPLRGEGHLGELIDLLTGCEQQESTTRAIGEQQLERDLDMLIGAAEKEYNQELEVLADGQENSNDDYSSLERIESFFSRLIVRVLGEKIFIDTGLGSEKPVELSRLRETFLDGLRQTGFTIESCQKLKRLGSGW